MTGGAKVTSRDIADQQHVTDVIRRAPFVIQIALEPRGIIAIVIGGDDMIEINQPRRQLRLLVFDKIAQRIAKRSWCDDQQRSNRSIGRR